MRQAGRLVSRVCSPRALTRAGRESMYRLYARYYAATSPERFFRDLEAKSHVLLMEDEGGNLQGFTTLLLDEARIGERPIRYLYSGDTIIHHHHWGSQALPLAWCELAGRFKAEAPERPLYWFLIVKGHRTYRYLKLFSRRYHPAPGREMLPEERRIMDGLAHRHFGQWYRAERGVVCFPESRGHLRSEWMALDERRRIRPEVAYFLERNPGHYRGDELVCLTELEEGNLRSLARSAFRRGLERSPQPEEKG